MSESLRRSSHARPTDAANFSPSIADRRQLVLTGDQPRHLRSRAAGVFLFLPLLAKLGFDTLTRQAGYPGTELIPADAALLSLLALKLLRKERLSHIDDVNVADGLGLFAGLNVFSKKTFATDYCYRTKRQNQQHLLEARPFQLSDLCFIVLPGSHKPPHEYTAMISCC